MESASAFRVFPYFATNSCVTCVKPRIRVRIPRSGCSNSMPLSSDTVTVDATSCIRDKMENGSLFIEGDNGVDNGENLKDRVTGKLESRVEKQQLKELELLWDDGYGAKTVKDYVDGAKEMIRPDGGPPRWFCPVDCGQPLKDSPVLLFLPGLDGVGLGLTLHHKALGKVFHVCCLHIPMNDRTPFEELVKFVEETVRIEHSSSPNRPIYLVGDSVGGCLALAVAARNPKTDLVLVLANPATSFCRSHLQSLFPTVEALLDRTPKAVPFVLSFILGNPVKMAMVGIKQKLPPRLYLEQLTRNLAALLPCVSVFSDAIPKDTLLWKLKLLKSAAAYANSRLHSVKAEVLVIASGTDCLLPSGAEAQRLKNSLQNCRIRYFKDNGHTILMEDGINLLTSIKSTGKYRRSRKIDFISDFLPPSMSELQNGFEEVSWLARFAIGPAMFSTLNDGEIVRGLAGVPNDGPVLFVGYHMLMGMEITPLAEEFLKEKGIMVRGLAYPDLFTGKLDGTGSELFADNMRIMGSVSATGRNLYKLLSTKSHVILYPGGVREALHYKGEEYKTIWPENPEFVRMAAKFGAKIVPFGTVGEDDIAELVLDYHDMMKIPILNDHIRKSIQVSRIRGDRKGEVANEEVFVPGLLPKIPGRVYYLFGKPIETEGMEEMLKDKENAKQLYLDVKSQVQCYIAYLLKKREEDPYRNIIDRTLYRAFHAPSHVIPAFDP